MRLSMLYLLSALAVAVVPLSAAAQESASLPTAASGDACAVGWRWVPAGYNKETEWASGHCERIPVPGTISASEAISDGPSSERTPTLTARLSFPSWTSWSSILKAWATRADTLRQMRRIRP